jgi:predicted MFS family arabinose efflux permease
MKGAYSIVFIIACYFIVNGIFVPAMPNVALYFQISGELTRETMTFFQLGALISCIIAGFFADAIGKKNFLLLGLFIAVIGSVICLISPSINLLFLGRSLQGIGAATGFMMGFALAVDLYKPEETLKIIALNGIVVACISVFIPIIGGIITSIWDWRATFVFIIPMFMIALINSFIGIPEAANIHREKLNLHQGLLDYIKVGTNKAYLCYAILNSIFIGGLIFSLSFLPFFYKNLLHIQESKIGLLIGTAIWLPFGLCSIYSVRIYSKLGIDKSIYLGLFTNFLGSSVMIFTAYLFQESLALNVLGAILYFGGVGILYSGSISKSLSVFMNLTTKASSLRTIMISVFSFLGALIAQYVSEAHLMSFALVLMGSTMLSTLFFLSRGREA